MASLTLTPGLHDPVGPPRPGTPGELAVLRNLLARAEFTAPAVCARAGIDSIYDFRSIREGRTTGIELKDRLDLLIRLFMDVELLERSTVDALLSADETGVLERLGLLSTHQGDARLCHAAVLLYPTESLWIISDLNVAPTGPADTVLSDDSVYPAVTKNTRHFLSSLPKTPCDSFLELCAGTGIAALLAARYARHTWAADITERSTRFAEFNAALNGIENFTAVQGDLYQPVSGKLFDRIVAHPPYMPSLEQKYIFRDGGDDGEQVTRRIIAGLPEHLRPGGRLYCTCMLTERRGAPAEARVRAMLGRSEADFDVVLVSFRRFDPTEYYFQLALKGRASLEEVVQRHHIFRNLEVESLLYCSMVIQRKVEVRPAFTARRQAGQGLGTKDVERLLTWEAALAKAADAGWLIDARPLASPHCRLRLDQTLRQGDWMPEQCLLSTAVPFAVDAKCPAWTATLIARCDGRRTAREHVAFLKDSGAVSREVPDSDLLLLIRSLIGGGFLGLPGDPRTPREEASAVFGAS
jgi:methylase of polypeptide subunit release factors